VSVEEGFLKTAAEAEGGIQFTIYWRGALAGLGVKITCACATTGAGIKMLVEMGGLLYDFCFVLLTPVPASPAQAPQVQAKMQ